LSRRIDVHVVEEGSASSLIRKPRMSQVVNIVRVMRPSRLLDRIISGAVKNARYEDFTTLIGALGFELDRTRVAIDSIDARSWASGSTCNH